MKIIKFKFLKEGEEKKLPPKPKDKFILDWTKALGWKTNPFDPKVDDPEKLVAGYEKERTKINLFVIKKYDFGILEGEDGQGKTTLLRWMTHELRKHRGRVYSSYVQGNELTGIHTSIRKIIWPILGPHERYATKPFMKLDLTNIVAYLRKKLKQKPLLLIVDDVSEISDVATVLLKKLFISEIPFQLIISGTEKEIKKSSLLDLSARDKLHIKLRDMDFEEAVKLISNRIEYVGGYGIQPFTEGQLEKLFNKARKNPQKFLELCYNNATEVAVEAWQVEQERLKSLQEQIRKEQLVLDKQEKKLEMEEKDFLSEIKKAQKSDDKKTEERLRKKEKQSEEKKKKIEEQKKELEITEKELKSDIDSLKKEGFKERDLGGDVDARKRRLESEKKLSNIFKQIKDNLSTKDDDEEGLF